jgi:chromosome segregation ATPase
MATADSIIEGIEELTNRVKVVNDGRDDYKKRMRAITNDIIHAIIEIKGVNSGMQTEIRTLTTQIREQQEEIVRLRTVGSSYDDNSKKLGEQIVVLSEKLKTKEAELVVLSTKLDENASNMKNMDDEIKGRNSKIDELNKNIAELNGEIATIKQHIDANNLSLEFLETNRKSLEEQLNSTIGKIQGSYAQLKASLEELLEGVNDDTQEENLNRILNALKKNEKAVVESAMEEIPQNVAPSTDEIPQNVELPPGFDELVQKLDKAIVKFFNEIKDADENVTGYKLKEPPDGGFAKLKANLITQVQIKPDVLNAIMEKHPDLKMKVVAYERLVNKLFISPRGGATKKKRNHKRRLTKKTKKRRRHSSTRKRHRKRHSKRSRR